MRMLTFRANRALPRRIAARSRARLGGLESLEARQMLSGAIAQLPLDASGPHPRVVLEVRPADFTLPRGGGVLLSFRDLGTNAGAGASASPSMTMTPHGKAHDRVLLQNPHPASGGNSLMIAQVGAGAFAIAMPAGSTPDPLQVALVGDVNGDGRVTQADLRAIHALIGTHAGQPGYVAAADIMDTGVINARDYQLARQNLGAATTLRPLAVSVEIDPASNPLGNGLVAQSDVTLSGQSAPGATVRLDQGGTGQTLQTVIADATGHYQFAVNLGLGATPFHVEATDPFGQVATADTTVRHGDVIVAWNQAMLDAIRATKDTLGLSTRTLAMVQAAMYDAVNDIDRFGSVYKVDVQAPAGASPEAAASEAAFVVLSALIPREAALYATTLADTLAGIPDAARAGGIAVGDRVATGILAWRLTDGSEVQLPYVPGTAPGLWQPTPPDYSVAWGPDWGQVTPFIIPNANQFQPPPPPAMNSPEYAAALNQVESLGALNSTTRTPEETQTGHFWGYDVGGIGPPPVLYNEITQAVALQQHNTLDQDARLFALANLAMGDAGVVAWQSKFADNLWRPITAIRNANLDGNPATVADPTWTPLGAFGDGVKPDFTPPFPGYVSGHATFGGALFSVLANFYGTDNLTFTIGSDELPGVTRTYTSFSAAAQENAFSRIYLGIHFNFDATNGVAAGNAVGNYVYQHALTPVR